MDIRQRAAALLARINAEEGRLQEFHFAFAVYGASCASPPAFDPRAVYSLDQLEAMLAPAVSGKVFLERLGVARRFKYLVLGADIVRALDSPPAESDLRTHPEAVIRALPSPTAPRRPRGRPRKDGTPPRRRVTMDQLRPDSVDRGREDG